MAVIGIDSHKDTLAGCAVDEAGRVSAQDVVVCVGQT